MTDAQQREAARKFYNTWHGRGNEKSDCQTYWTDLLSNVLGMEDIPSQVNFEKPVIIRGQQKYIDVYLPESRVLIEQKSLKKDLSKPIRQSDGSELTPYEQAKQYSNDLPLEEKPRWIIVSNFEELRIYNMNTREPEKEYESIMLEDIQNQYHRLNFLLKEEEKIASREMEVSIAAGEIVGLLYDAFAKQYTDPESDSALKSLNILCVRLVFCLYAEDAGIFGKHGMFHDYLAEFDVQKMRKALVELFKILNTPENERDPYLKDDNPLLAEFPYVNGGLFANEVVDIPPFTDEIKDLLLKKASDDFNWSEISPTIFGAVFESTLNPDTRRKGGMHYTSIENIHKVIDPLFLEDLNDEFKNIKATSSISAKERKLYNFQNKLASLTFLDPACGSGNFLTETYLSIRRLENNVITENVDIKKGQTEGQMTFGYNNANPVRVSISQFYGIEINDFAVTVAKTALWIAESQMLRETAKIIHNPIDFLPLKTNAFIHEGNALSMNWESVVSRENLSYIIGNPPFIGARLMSNSQKEDVLSVFGTKWKGVGNLDYVSCWYKKAADMMENYQIRTAFVSTNSITQGEQVAALWKPLFSNGIHIDFAYRTFVWDSEANMKAHVHCVIIGFSTAKQLKDFIIYENNHANVVKNINAYLLDAENIFVENQSSPICKGSPLARSGNKPIDDGNYLFTEEEKDDFLEKEPLAQKYFKPWYGSYEFINRKPRWCLWLGDCLPNELKKMPECLKRIEAVRDFRLRSKSAGTRKLAEFPTRFHVETFLDSPYLVLPLTSSERRRYVHIGFMPPDVLASNLVVVVADATIYDFGILTSNVFMAWMRSVCGRLKSDYRITKDNVYNNFPWPSPSEEQKKKIEQTAQAILDARALYPDSSLADLYDPLTMPLELSKAHDNNNRAVMQAYGFSIKGMSEAACVAELMRMYQEKVNELEGK